MKTAAESFDRAYQIVKRLRAPDGCPWDREQTPASMRASLIEEAYECVEAINENDKPHVREELGDVFLLAIFIAYMYEEAGEFSVSDSLEELSEKLVRRHPHVFGDAAAADSGEVLRQWDVIKETIEGRAKKDSVLDEVSRALPPLERAYKLQKKAAKAGFDWLKVEDVWDKLAEELAECREACDQATDAVRAAAARQASGPAIAAHNAGADPAVDAAHDHIEDELGDLLFSVVNISRYLKVDPAVALHRAIGKFDRRFRHVERSMKASGQAMTPDTFGQMDLFWDEAKAAEKAGI